MSDSLIKIGIVGCGEHSHEHMKAARKVKGVRITACCDIVESKAKDISFKYGCDSYYGSLETMLQKEKLDAVILCTWPMQHLEQIETCLNHGIKNILCEKALTLSASEAESIFKMVEKKGAFLLEGFKYRYHPAIRKMESILSYNDIGKIDSIRATFSNYEPEEELEPGKVPDWRYRKECGGGVPYDWMSYLVNACNHFSGGMPKKVYAIGNESSKYGVIYRIFGMIEYDNGIVGIIESSKEANFSQELQITCTNGILRLPVSWGIYGEVKITQTHRKPEWGYILTDTYEIEEANSFVIQLQNFADVIRGKEEPLISLRESIINAHVIEALVKSVTEKRTLELDFTNMF
ncbi:MAG TPA: Gfo/Idh/MocA family oxidoreductase [Clostridia bacterium]|nr:Gfo/Idh/MocA family oxidoreductase [Clostridia bacterium]